MESGPRLVQLPKKIETHSRFAWPSCGAPGVGCAGSGQRLPQSPLQPHARGGAAVTHPLPLRSLRHTPLPCHPAPDSGSGSGCSLQPRLSRLPIRRGLRWLRLDVLVQGPPGPTTAGLRSPSAGVMRANAVLQVLGFLLSLARGSEVGNSQAGKRRRSIDSLGTWDSEPSARSCGAASGDPAARD